MRLVLLGDPVDHSLSPIIQRAALAAAGISGSYEARRVDETGLRAALAEISQGHLDGANVTMPHKRRACELADELTDDARRAGAVNTLLRDPAGVMGANTDIVGVRVAWQEAGLPGAGPVLVLGAGGAAAAALLALCHHSLAVSARNRTAAAALLDSLGLRGDVVEWGSPAGDGAVVVNATPLGMGGEALPPRTLEGATGLFDMAYGGGVTPAGRWARGQGVPTAEGLDMLVAQAAASFRLWTGQEASPPAMRGAVGPYLRATPAD